MQFFSHGVLITSHIDFVSIMNNAVKNSICDCVVSNHFMPVFNWHPENKKMINDLIDRADSKELAAYLKKEIK